MQYLCSHRAWSVRVPCACVCRTTTIPVALKCQSRARTRVRPFDTCSAHSIGAVWWPRRVFRRRIAFGVCVLSTSSHIRRSRGFGWLSTRSAVETSAEYANAPHVRMCNMAHYVLTAHRKVYRLTRECPHTFHVYILLMKTILAHMRNAKFTSFTSCSSEMCVCVLFELHGKRECVRLLCVNPKINRPPFERHAFVHVETCNMYICARPVKNLHRLLLRTYEI